MPARAVAVVDTVGAGDTFNAGILAALAAAGLLDRAALRALGPQQIDAALALATRAAAITASRAGANPPWLHDLGVNADPRG
jgi:fructokinase